MKKRLIILLIVIVAGCIVGAVLARGLLGIF